MAGLGLCAKASPPLDDDLVSASSFTQIEPLDATSSPDTPAAPWHGDWHTRSQLTGDWFGARDALAEHGLTFYGDVTQYYQGVAAGGLAQQFQYGGRGDYLFDLDTGKLGLWEGGRLDLRAETRLGQDCNQIDGAVAPSNFAMALPLLDREVTALTGVQISQDISDQCTILVGKLNLLDGTPESYARGMRLNYFWNTAMQNNLSRSYLFPSTLGAGFTVRDEVEPVFNFYLMDTHYTPTTSGFSTLFSNGVLLYGEYRRRTNWFELPGHCAVCFLYSTAKRTPLDANPYALLKAIALGEPLPVKHSAWTVTSRCDQVLWADTQDPNRNWTLNSDVGLTDGNPNPIQWFGNVSLLGNGLIRGRENDTIGIGYYHLGVSNQPILKKYGFGDENGVELFYNVAVRPWFHLTPDLQILDPARREIATALLVGIRGRLSF